MNAVIVAENTAVIWYEGDLEKERPTVLIISLRWIVCSNLKSWGINFLLRACHFFTDAIIFAERTAAIWYTGDLEKEWIISSFSFRQIVFSNLKSWARTSCCVTALC